MKLNVEVFLIQPLIERQLQNYSVILAHFICFNVVIFYYSTPELVLRDQGRCCPPQAPVWRTSAPHRSSNATATANATIMPPHTASG